MKKCKYCSMTDEETRIIGDDVCFKHYQQIRKYGKIIRTSRDANNIRVDGDVAYIDLYNRTGEVKATATIDSRFVELVKPYKWYARKLGYVASNADDSGSNKQFLHRLITGCPEGKTVDHINRDPLDNRLQNLRVCTMSENTRNRQYCKTNGHVGVKLVGSGNYQAAITVNYKTIYIGTYNTFEEAVEARKEAEGKYFGDYSAAASEKVSSSQE